MYFYGQSDGLSSGYNTSWCVRFSTGTEGLADLGESVGVERNVSGDV
jgi:hypothetical protein